MNNLISFADGMRLSSNYKNKEHPDKWDVIEKLYNEFDIQQKKQIIPKIIHQIWLGGPLPKQIIPLIETVRQCNPEYKHILWTDKDVESFNFKNKELFYSTPNYGQRSDILRYAILEKMGGIYLDTDFYCHKSFDNILSADLFAGVAYSRFPEIFNGLIGSTPGNELIADLNEIENLKWGSGMEIIDTTGPYFFTRKFFKHTQSKLNLLPLPVVYFYPFPNFNNDRVNGPEASKYTALQTICTHLWHSLWN